MIAAERDRPDVVERRKNFTIARRFVDPGSLVFLDESSAKTNMTRLYGWSSIGERCIDRTQDSRWKTMTMLSAIRLDGPMQDATVLLDGPMNRETFLSYTPQCLAPSLRPGDVVLMDNLSSHKTIGVRESIEAADATLWYLPPYSPDLNPIEMLWSKAKAWLRRVAAKTFESISDTIADVLNHVTKTETINYFKACGYGDYL